MAQEELMRQLPVGVEESDIPGPFFIRNNGGSFSLIVLTEILVTCGGEDGKERAARLACTFNEVWDQSIGNNSKDLAQPVKPKEKDI